MGMQTEDSIYGLFHKMEEDRIILSFKGQITPELLASVYRIMEVRMNHEKEEPRRKKKFYHILVECLQNVYHHMGSLKEETRERDNAAIFMIGYGKGASYRIITGNFIQNKNVEILKSRIEHINSLSPEALRQYYVEQLAGTELSEKGGAGLGLIDMARKSGQKLEYSFHEVSSTLSFFSLSVTIY